MLSTFDYSCTTKAATQPVGIKEEMIKKSAMAPIWQVGENTRCVRSSRARQRGLWGHQGDESTQLSLSSIHPSSTEPSVCQDKQMRRHMLERLLENCWESFSSRTRWKEVCNSMVFVLLHTVNVSSRHTMEECIIYFQLCNRVLWLWTRKVSLLKLIITNPLSNEISDQCFIEYKQSSVHTQWSVLPREKQTNDKAKYYSVFICNKQMVAKLKEITYTLSSLYGFALIAAIITPTFPLYNEVN